MKLGIIGPSRCNCVEIEDYIKGLRIDEIITNFYQAMRYAEHHNIPYINVCRILPPTWDYHGFYDDGTNKQLEYIATNCDVLLEFSFYESHFNDFSFAKPRKFVKVYKNSIPRENHYTTVEIRKDTYYTVERRDHEFKENRSSLVIYQFQELQEYFHDHLRLEIYGDLQNKKIYGLESLTLMGTSLDWLKSILENNFPDIFVSNRINFELHYLKGRISRVLCEFKGYSNYHKDNECISLKQQFDILEKDEGLKDDRWLCKTFGEVPLFIKFQNENTRSSE